MCYTVFYLMIRTCQFLYRLHVNVCIRIKTITVGLYLYTYIHRPTYIQTNITPTHSFETSQAFYLDLFARSELSLNADAMGTWDLLDGLPALFATKFL